MVLCTLIDGINIWGNLPHYTVSHPRQPHQHPSIWRTCFFCKWFCFHMKFMLGIRSKCECETHTFPNMWDPFARDSKLPKSIAPKSKNGYTCLMINHMVKEASFFHPTSRVQTNRTQFTIRSKQGSNNMLAHLPETLQLSTFYPQSKCNTMRPGTLDKHILQPRTILHFGHNLSYVWCIREREREGGGVQGSLSLAVNAIRYYSK
jgi:hypothetical protein